LAQDIAELETRRATALDDTVRAILATVQDFCAGQPSDDLTLMIVRVR
jgi:serine phosphatase RsbU (regulator of sigma subunit)